MAKDDKEMVGYRQQPGKLLFNRPGSGGKNPLSSLRDESMIPESQGGGRSQPWGSHVHDELVTSSSIGKRTPLIDSQYKVTGQAQYGDDFRLPGEAVQDESHPANYCSSSNSYQAFPYVHLCL